MRISFSPCFTLRPGRFHAYTQATRVALGFCRAVSRQSIPFFGQLRRPPAIFEDGLGPEMPGHFEIPDFALAVQEETDRNGLDPAGAKPRNAGLL
jgi:hypothetical protein